MRLRKLLPFFAVMLALAAIAPSIAAHAAEDPAVARGRYLVVAGGCNDCHTPGYAEAEGGVSTDRWLTGSPVGFRGPWGTSYPANLRLYVQNIDEKAWLASVRQPMLPPMPWFNLRNMTDADLVSIYRFVRELGPAGEPAPAAAAPGEAVSTPYIDFVPKNLPKQAQK